MNNTLLLRHLILLSIIGFASQLQGQRQSTWELYSTNIWTNEMVVRNDTAYLATSAGLWIIDVQNNNDTLHNALNFSEIGFHLKEIAITESGDIWMSGGHDTYLFQYDGDTIKNYYQESENKLISYAFELITSGDELWFWNNREVWSYANDEFIDYSNSITRAPDMQFDSEKTLWYISRGEIFKFKDNTTLKITEIPDELDDVIAYYIDKNDTHWLCMYHREPFNDIYEYYVFTFKDGIWKKYDQQTRVKEFSELENGELHFFSWLGFGKILENEVIYDSLHLAFPSLSKQYDRLTPFHVEKDGTKWMKARNNYIGDDLYRISENDTTLYSRNSPGNIQLHPDQLLKDCEGNIFAVSGDKLQKFQNNSWSTVAIPKLDENTCNSMSLALNPHTCEIWAYSESNFDCFSLWKLVGEEMVEYNIISEGGCDSMDFDSEGLIYLVIRGRLLTLDSVGAVQLFHEEIDSYSGVHLGIDDSVWAFGSFDNKSKILRIKDDQSTEITPPDVNGYNTGIFFETNKGNILFREGRYLHEFNGSEWNLNTLDLGLDVEISDIEEDDSGNFWVGLQGKGIAYWDGTNTIQFNVSNSLIPSNYCYNLTSVNDTTLWMTHRNGTSVMTIDPVDIIIEKEEEEEETELEEEIQISIYPNPSSGRITITHPELKQKTIDIFSMSGAFVSSHTSDDVVYSLNLETGIYWVKLIETDINNKDQEPLIKKLFVLPH